MIKKSLFILLAVWSIHNCAEAAVEQTFTMVKPDGVAAGHIGDVIQRYEHAGLQVKALKMTKLSRKEAQEFYDVHKDRPFYPDLVEFITSGPVVGIILEGDDAIAKTRSIMGATDYKKAAPGTIRADFATSVQNNVVHGSDSKESADKEITLFFGQ